MNMLHYFGGAHILLLTECCNSSNDGKTSDTNSGKCDGNDAICPDIDTPVYLEFGPGVDTANEIEIDLFGAPILYASIDHAIDSISTSDLGLLLRKTVIMTTASTAHSYFGARILCTQLLTIAYGFRTTTRDMDLIFIVGRLDIDNILRIFIAYAITKPHNDRDTGFPVMLIRVFGLLDIHSESFYEKTSVQTSAMTFATVHSDMVLFFRLNTQSLSWISSVCIGYPGCHISEINYFCAVSLWVIIGCINTSQMYRRHRHPSCCNFDFSPAISVGGIYYGGDILYKYTEQGERIDDKAMDITSYRRFIQRTVHLFRMKDNSRALHHFKLAVDSTETQFNPNDGSTTLNQIDINVDFTNLHFKTTNARALSHITFLSEMSIKVEFELAATAQQTVLNDATNESNVLSLHWYARAVLYIDHGFIFETQFSDLSSKFNIAANGMTGVHVHYLTKSVLVDILRRILRTTYGVSVDSDDQHLTLVLCLVHFDARNTIAATTHIWNMVLTTKSHSEGMAHDKAGKGRISEAEFYDFNLNSIGGYATARAVTALMLVALMSRCSYDFPTIVAILYGGRDFKYMHHAEDYIVFTNARVIRSRDIDQTVSYRAVSIVGQAMKPRGNSQSSTALPLFRGHESPFNAMQTDVIFLQQDETANFDNVNGSVINLNNILYSIIAGSTAGSVVLKDKMMNACGTEATKIVNRFEGYVTAISYSLGNFSPLSLLCDAEFSKIFGRLSANHAVFSYQFDYSDMISLSCISDHYAFISEILYACIITSLGTDYCSVNSALITNYFHRHRPNPGRDEHNCATKPFQSQQRGPINGDFTDVFGTINIASTALIGGYVSATTTTQRRRQNVTSYWSGG